MLLAMLKHQDALAGQQVSVKYQLRESRQFRQTVRWVGENKVKFLAT